MAGRVIAPSYRRALLSRTSWQNYSASEETNRCDVGHARLAYCRAMNSLTVVLANLGFFVCACGILLWAQWRTQPGPVFPGPQPVGPIFKVWLVVIWLVGMILPLIAVVAEWSQPVQLALLPYFATFILQIATELFVWKRWRSPVWVLVPCLYLPWRLFQSGWGLIAIDNAVYPLTAFTLACLFGLWLINIGVHYTNIVNTLRWANHPADAQFPALRDPRVFTRDAQ